MFNRYPALLLLLPYLSGLILGPVAFIGWAFKAAIASCGCAAMNPAAAVKHLIPILMAASGALVQATNHPLPEGSAPARLTGVIMDGPWEYERFSRASTLRVLARVRGGEERVGVILAGDLPHDLGPGDRIRFPGRLRIRKGRMNIETRRELINVLGKDSRYLPFREVYRMRRALWNGLQETLCRRSASLSAAMLLGLSGTVAPGVKDLFRNTGTAHLLAISGLHVGILCAMLVFIMGRLGVGGRIRFWLLLGTLLVFCLLSGGRIPVMRAYLVCVIHLFAARAKRPVDPFLPLFNACLVLLLLDPGAFLELSFQLSFAGYGSILAFLKIRSLIFSMGAKSRGIMQERAPLQGLFFSFMRKTVLLSGVSTASWLGTLPLTLHYFKYFNPWAPAVNLLVFPLFVAALNLGAIHLATAAIGLHRSLLTAWPAETCLSMLVKWLETLDTIPPGRVDTPPIPGAAVLISYALILMVFMGGAKFAASRGKNLGDLRDRDRQRPHRTG